jgi:hypothetical protein
MTVTRYVNTNGSNAFNGTSSALAWATVAHAKTQIRSLIASNPTEDYVIILGDGRHAVTEELAFTELDSPRYPGTVTWKAASGASPVISGGVPITTWTLHDAGNNIWVADFAASEFRQLYVNGVRCRRARRNSGLTGSPTATATGFNTNDVVTTYANPSAIEFGFRKPGLWFESRIAVSSVVASTSVTMTDPTQSWYIAFGDIHVARLPTWIENAYEILVAEADPGTFYLNTVTDKVYLIPPTGVTNPNSATVIAPQLQSLLTVTDARRINFENIAFEHATWLPTNGGLIEVQAMLISDAYLSGSTYTYDKIVYYGQLTAGNCKVSDSRDINFTRCKFQKMGSHGLHIADGSEDIKLVGTIVRDCSAHGVVLGTGYTAFAIDPPTNVLIDNCVVSDIGVEFPGAVGICDYYPRALTISHCDISDLPYSGISVGLGWTRKHHYRTTPNAGYRILNNRIRDVVQIMDDGGGVYTNGPSRSSLIQGNYITGVPAANGIGIYLDEGSQRIGVNRNVVADCTKWFKHHRALGDITTTGNHSDTLDYEFVARDTQLDGDYNGAAAYVYSQPTIFDPDNVGSAQQRIMLDAGLEAAYEDLLDE